jgi:hypothetical protein
LRGLFFWPGIVDNAFVREKARAPIGDAFVSVRLQFQG